MMHSRITSDRFAGYEVVALLVLAAIAIAVVGALFSSILPQI
jgi:hypothetical protein